MDHIASSGHDELIIHVAEWNQSAVQMYMNEGFRIVKQDYTRFKEKDRT